MLVLLATVCCGLLNAQTGQNEFKKVAMPSRNFNMLGRITIKDPLDGKEKIALHTFSAAKCGMLVIIDPETLTGESYETPGDHGAWALCQYDDALLIGSCPNAALIYNFDLKSRKFKGEPAKAPGVTYIWTLERASDGFVYGGTYAACRLMKYDPATHAITDLGRVDPDEKNWYSRNVKCDVPGLLFIQCGYSTNRIFTYDLETKKFSQFHKDGYSISYLSRDFVCVSGENGNELLDPYTGNKLFDRPFQLNETEALSKSNPIFEKYLAEVNKKQDPRIASLKLPSPYQLENGDFIGFQGQEIYKLKKSALEPEYQSYPVAPPPTCAFGIAVDDEGKVWGTSSFGMTAFCYDPKTGETVNTLDVSRSGGECYGVVPYGGKIYFTAYAGGEHIVYDPKEPWDMRGGLNPKMVRSVAPAYIRPHTRSITNGDGVIWTGWMANYGTYGSAITRWDVNSGEITLFPDLIGENAIDALTIYNESVIFTTSKHGNGLPSVNDAPKYICRMTSDGKIVKKTETAKSLGSICVNGNKGIISIGQELCLLDPESLDVKPIEARLPGAQIRKFGKNIIAVGRESCYIIDQNSGNILLKTGGVGASFLDVCVKGNDVWAVGTDGWIYRMTVDANISASETRQKKQIEVPTGYYAHFGADYNLDVPAEGFGGWGKTVLPLNLEHTALCVMHAWDNPDQKLYPGIYSAVEYLPRAAAIYKERMPALLKTFRDAGVRVIHIESGDYVRNYDAYRQTQELIGEQLSESRKAKQFAMPNPASDPVIGAYHKFRNANVHPGTENLEGIRGAQQVRDIHESVKPLPGEYMVTDSDELQAVCARHGINHLIYAGFAINCCLLISPGGMIDMSRRGFICSTVKEVTTAVENDFSARDEMAKQLALWYTALFFGFVYEQADLEASLGTVTNMN